MSVRIAIVSNCQGESLAACMNAMSSKVSADFQLVSQYEKNPSEFAHLFRDYDYILTQPAYINTAYQLLSKVVTFPNIFYNALHPDMTLLRGINSSGQMETISGLMSVYHSPVMVTCYRAGLDVKRTIEHFDPYIFGKLGYFDVVDAASQLIIEEGQRADLPLAALLSRWKRRGAFMYSFNHPDLEVMADIAREVLKKMNIAPENSNIHQFTADPLRRMPIWPIYPSVAERFDFVGDYNFVNGFSMETFTLQQLTESCFSIYDKYDKSTIEPLNFYVDDYSRKLGFVPGYGAPEKVRNPYLKAKSYQFWSDSVAKVAPDKLDPVSNPTFQIEKSDKVATAGSCFAQHIARTLHGKGFNYFVPESAPKSLSPAESLAENYGTYSARYGNIYTVRQLLQLIDRAYGRFWPRDSAWTRKDGRLVDPFRPQISAKAFETVAELEASRQEHFKAVRQMLEEMDVFVFTLGLTEGWRSKLDGAVFPLAPGVAGAEMDYSLYEFVNFTAEEISLDLARIMDRLRQINPACKVVLTVSPVPLIATYEPRHALDATTYSKSVLRTVAEQARKQYPNVDYFPSFEIITGSYNRGAYFDDDLRTVKEEGVQHVMSVFIKNYTNAVKAHPESSVIELEPKKEPTPKKPSVYDIVCDENAIVNFRQ